jgi:DNA primase
MDKTTFQQFVTEVRQRTDLPALVAETVELHGSGGTRKGRSPKHPDTDPSLVVWVESQRWRDYAGGGEAGGDCFDWLGYRTGCSFWDALTQLADRAGLKQPDVDDATFHRDRALAEERREVERLLTLAAEYYHSRLRPDDRETRLRVHYGFTDQTIDGQLLGWADGTLWSHMTRSLGVPESHALRTGLFTHSGTGVARDFFRNRLVFPYWRGGRVVYMAARATELCGESDLADAKYLKLLTADASRPHISETVTNRYFFNEDGANGAAELLVAEGITDCIAAMQAGFKVISPATTNFASQDVPKLVSLARRAKTVVICNDSEENAAGEKGALKTAEPLFRAGIDVRIATLPRPQGCGKIDLNDFLKSHSADDARAVLGAALRYPEFLIQGVPADTPHLDLMPLLRPILKAIAPAPAIERDAYADQMIDRFGVGRRALKTALEEAAAEAEADADAPDARATMKGEVVEGDSCYSVADDRGRLVVISSFKIVPKLRIVAPTTEVIEADVVTDSGSVLPGMRFPRACWNSTPAFLKVLKSVNLQWTGSDENVQGVLRRVAAMPMERREGTENLGLHESAEGACWVSPRQVLEATCTPPRANPVVYLPVGASLAERLRYTDPSPDEVRHLASEILPALLEVNTYEVMVPALAWLFASLVRPRIVRHTGQFPLLCIWGTQGSGKSSLASEVLWPLSGVDKPEAYSATETEFAMIRLLSSTDSVAVVIDEYKPYDMPAGARQRLHRILRRLYKGEAEERGRSDLSTVSFHLTAPVCLVGETRPTEPALVERMLAVNPDKNELGRNPARKAAFERVRAAGPGGLAAAIVRFALAQHTAAGLTASAAEVDALLASRDVPLRFRSNLAVMVLGYRMFERFAAAQGVRLPTVELAPVVDAMASDLLEAGGNAVRSTLDQFLETLSAMAVRKRLTPGGEFVTDGAILELHFPSCHGAFTEYCRETGYDGEKPDAKSLRAQIRESVKAEGYVRAADDLVCFAGRGDRRRAVTIDLVKARKTLCLDGFGGGTKDDGTDPAEDVA